jgi:hypothetical protein
MQQTQQRELPERISWARAMIFAVGYFFIAAILVAQVPGYIYDQMTSATLQGFEIGTLSMGVVLIACFAVIITILMLFDPKPVLPPVLFTGLGTILIIVGLALAIGTTATGNQYFPSGTMHILPLLGGNFLWFQPDSIDFFMVGLGVLGVGAAMVFYSILAMGEQRNPDRRDLGVTAGMRVMIILSVLFLVAFLIGYTYLPAAQVVNTPTSIILDVIMGAAIFLALGAFALRLHYLMRPVRKNTMSGLYSIGALGLAQTGAILLLLWLVAYPLVAWLHTWSFIGLGSFLTVCSKASSIPASCSFTPDAGYLVDAIFSGGTFTVMVAAIWAWKTHRNLVVIGSILITAVIAIMTLLVHTVLLGSNNAPGYLPTAMLLTAAILVLATIWSAVARREFAVVGESNLGCIGMMLVVGTCLFIYIGAFAFFSIPLFQTEETPPNIPYWTNTPGATDAFTVILICAILAGIQFFFLVRNRYRV